MGFSSSAGAAHVQLPTASVAEMTAPTAEARAGDLFEKYFDLVWRAVRAFGVARDDADDAAQQVFMVAAGKLDSIAHDSVRAFLFGTARGVAANYRRRKARKPEVLDEAAMLAVLDDGPSLDESIDDTRAHALLDHVISGLDEDLRTVFVFFELEEMSASEIASVLEIPIGTVSSRLRRAREQFHASVKRLRAASTHRDGGVR